MEIEAENTDTIYYMLASLVYLQQEKCKKSKKFIKLADIDEENIFRTTCGISEKMCQKR